VIAFLKYYKPRKPDSVSKLSFIWPCNYLQDLAAYPGTQASRFQTFLYVALQHPRFTRPSSYLERPCAFTAHFHLFH